MNITDLSGQTVIGSLLAIIGLPVILFPALFLSSTSDPSTGSTLFGLLIGIALGGLIVAGGIALLKGKPRYATYSLILAGIEYISIELYDGYSGGFPLFLIVGTALTGIGYLIWKIYI